MVTANLGTNFLDSKSYDFIALDNLWAVFHLILYPTELRDCMMCHSVSGTVDNFCGTVFVGNQRITFVKEIFLETLIIVCHLPWISHSVCFFCFHYDMSVSIEQRSQHSQAFIWKSWKKTVWPLRRHSNGLGEDFYCIFVIFMVFWISW